MNDILLIVFPHSQRSEMGTFEYLQNSIVATYIEMSHKYY